jgi:hypothetical protein
MSNGARHTWGFFVGAVLTAAFAALLIFGSYKLHHGVTQFNEQDQWTGGGMLACAAVVFALLIASRLSPVASLVGGLALTAAGVVFFVSQATASHLIGHLPYLTLRETVNGLEANGLVLVAGVALLFASLFPSRWRSRDTDPIGYEYAASGTTDPLIFDSASGDRNEQPGLPV